MRLTEKEPNKLCITSTVSSIAMGIIISVHVTKNCRYVKQIS